MANPTVQGGQRAGFNSGGSSGSPRHARKARMTGASVICAISFLREWQKGQRRISISKTRFINSAHVYFLLLRTALTAPDLVFRRRQCRVLSSGFGSGTTTARSAALGANTPKQVTRFCRGGGIRAHNLSMKTSGGKTRAFGFARGAFFYDHRCGCWREA